MAITDDKQPFNDALADADARILRSVAQRGTLVPREASAGTSVGSVEDAPSTHATGTSAAHHEEVAMAHAGSSESAHVMPVPPERASVSSTDPTTKTPLPL